MHYQNKVAQKCCVAHFNAITGTFSYIAYQGMSYTQSHRTTNSKEGNAPTLLSSMLAS